MIIDFYEMCKRIKGDIMPSDERKKTIEQKVNSIISQYKIGEAGFDITKFLINCEGFEIGLQYMDDDTTGMLIVDDNNYLPNTNTHRLIIINETLKIQKDLLLHMNMDITYYIKTMKCNLLIVTQAKKIIQRKKKLIFLRDVC